MDFAGLTRALRLHWRLVAVCTVVALAIGWFSAPEPGAVTPNSPRFQATTTLVPGDTSVETANLGLAAYLVTANDVPRMAAETLGTGTDAEALRESISTFVDPDVGTLAISAVDLDRDRAVAVAEAVTEATTTFLAQDAQADRTLAIDHARAELEAITMRMGALENQIETAEDPPPLLQAQLDAETAQYSIVYSTLHELSDPANQPTSGLSTIGTTDVTEVSESSFITPPARPLPRALLFGAVGLLLGVLAALAVGRLDTRLRHRGDVENVYGVPILAEVPRMTLLARRRHDLVVTTQPYTADAESYRTLRSALRLAAQKVAGVTGEAPSVILVTSARSSEGKSTTIANLATALAEAGQSVLVIDADFRNPRQDEFLDALPGIGLRELATTPGELDVAKAVRESAVPGVKVLTNGTADVHPASLMMRVDDILGQARDLADIVLIDGAPLPVASETLDIAQNVDAALLTCRSGRTSAEEAAQLRKLLDRSRTPVLGVALVGVQRPTPSVLSRGASSSVHRRQRRSDVTNRAGLAIVGEHRNRAAGASSAPGGAIDRKE